MSGVVYNAVKVTWRLLGVNLCDALNTYSAVYVYDSIQ